MGKMKIPWFNRWASKHGVDDSDLLDIINDLEQDVYDVDLGGGLYKMRVARESEGKSGGYRTILVYKEGERAIFMMAFAKKDQANISTKDLKDLKKLGKMYLGYTKNDIELAVSKGMLIEIGE